ncbi:glycosyltransferase [Granulicella sp. 5B5]|uniref:glycosyltransferase family 2 protein n=1 Tax=Granulicella sp. 5B5 TaxID=1617967 RepID=UPI001C71289E|nr:glycosyltransferase [Granulicella sp. 5B5]
MTQSSTEIHRKTADISVGVPAYSRPGELEELLRSIYAQTVLPGEITICEDKSPEREQIRAVVERWRKRFTADGCVINYIENEKNLGFDGNLRRVIGDSHCRWVMLMGNDDAMLPHCIETSAKYLSENSSMAMVSRSFVRFDESADKFLGVSRLSNQNQVYRVGDSQPRMIFRTTGFIAGLIIDRHWAERLATERYDGTLYYQIYLAAEAFCEQGIGYIAEPIVAGRSGNAPLFGASASEGEVHIPGSYSPKGRAKMWASVLRIARDVGAQFHVDLETDIKHDLEVKQSFHIFEMYVGSDRAILKEMRDELAALGLFDHPLPRFLYALNYTLGRRAGFFYYGMRKVLQRK